MTCGSTTSVLELSVFSSLHSFRFFPASLLTGNVILLEKNHSPSDLNATWLLKDHFRHGIVFLNDQNHQICRKNSKDNMIQKNWVLEWLEIKSTIFKINVLRKQTWIKEQFYIQDKNWCHSVTTQNKQFFRGDKNRELKAETILIK